MFSRSSLPWLLLTALPAVATAQDRVPRVSPDPQAMFAEPFSRISGLRELPDGRLMIADRTEQIVAYLDFARGTLERVGREGEGPGEYRNPIGLFPLPGNATLLADLGNMRMTVIEADGTLETSYPVVRQGANQEMLFIRPEGTDTDGRVYFSTAGVVAVGRGGNQPAAADSAPVLRMPAAAEAYDTVGMLALPPVIERASPIRLQGGGAVRVSGAMPQPYAPRDDWGVAPNGDVIVVRANPYRVDRYTPDGRLRRGPEIAYQPVRVTRAIKEAWAERMSGSAAAFRTQGGGGASFRIQAPDIDDVEFPEFMPPFVDNAVFVAPDGEVWVATAGPPDVPPSYDVFDTAGQLVRRVRLERGRQLVAVGADYFYAVAIDEDDLQWLERYRRP